MITLCKIPFVLMALTVALFACPGFGGPTGPPGVEGPPGYDLAPGESVVILAISPLPPPNPWDDAANKAWLVPDRVHYTGRYLPASEVKWFSQAQPATVRSFHESLRLTRSRDSPPPFSFSFITNGDPGPRARGHDSYFFRQ